MIDHDEPMSQPLPPQRLYLNGIPLIPFRSSKGVVLNEMWVLPGGEVISTHQATLRAKKNGWPCKVVLN